MITMTTTEKIRAFLINLIGKYLVWIVVAIVIISWVFFPSFTNQLGDVLLFWTPVFIILFSLLIILTRNAFKFKKDREQGIFSYDISVTSFEFNLADIIIYCGTLAIIFSAQIFSEKGIDFTDLIQALIFFGLAYCIKQLFYKKTIK